MTRLEYTVVYEIETQHAETGRLGETAEHLAVQVRDFCEEGWEPVGGVAIGTFPGEQGRPVFYMAQAMTRELYFEDQ